MAEYLIQKLVRNGISEMEWDVKIWAQFTVKYFALMLVHIEIQTVIEGHMQKQYGGPDGEIGASLRYLSQRYSMPYRKVAAVLTDIGSEEIGHYEMVATIVHQLTKNMTMEQIKEAGFQEYFVDHTSGVYAQAAAGFPFDALCFASKGDAITDLHEDMAAEQKARTTYDNILTCWTRFASCVREKLCIISVSVKRCESFRIIWTLRISTPLIRSLI